MPFDLGTVRAGREDWSFPHRRFSGKEKGIQREKTWPLKEVALKGSKRSSAERATLPNKGAQKEGAKLGSSRVEKRGDGPDKQECHLRSEK